ncbi:hypothetical protein Pelo_6746 [Pelomyxa schiedti]|nr:hypothetical protein Pelo_6746 [Pelomyxa schiedti]
MATSTTPTYWRVIPLRLFRKKDDVEFRGLPMTEFSHIDGVDHVEHGANAKSPGMVNGVDGWYYHPCQEDNLLVCRGIRTSILMHASQPGVVEVFEVGRSYIKRNGEIICSEPAVLQWAPRTWHKVNTTSAEGSTSINFAVRHPGFDLHTEFNIYDLDTSTMTHKLLREGREDQM